jgi:transcriptional regulator with XRE-family HTH domain
MGKISEVAEHVRALRGSLGSTQEQFAHRVGVRPAAVSGWESGDSKYAPGAAALIALGRLAAEHGRPEEALWLLKRAGLDERAILRAGEQVKRERHIGAPHPAEVVRVPVQTPAGEKAGPALVLDARLVPNPGATRCVVLAEGGLGNTWPVFRQGDMLLVDGAQADLDRLVGQFAMVRLTRPEGEENWMQERWPVNPGRDERYQLGTLRIVPNWDRPPEWVVNLAAPWDSDPGWRLSRPGIPIGWAPGDGTPVRLCSGCEILGRVTTLFAHQADRSR